MDAHFTGEVAISGACPGGPSPEAEVTNSVAEDKEAGGLEGGVTGLRSDSGDLAQRLRNQDPSSTGETSQLIFYQNNYYGGFSMQVVILPYFAKL